MHMPCGPHAEASPLGAPAGRGTRRRRLVTALLLQRRREAQRSPVVRRPPAIDALVPVGGRRPICAHLRI